MSGNTQPFNSDGGFSTVGNVTGNVNSTNEVIITTDNEHGGAGYTGFITMTSTQANVSNPNKYVRTNVDGNLEIINSAYTATIMSLSDAGNLTVPGGISGGNVTTGGSGGDIALTGGNIYGANVITAATIGNAAAYLYGDGSNISNLPTNYGATGATGVTGATGPIYYGIAPSDYVVQAQLSTNQTVTAGADTVVQYTYTSDPQEWYDNTNHRFQPNKAGWYNIEYSVLWATGTGTGQVNTQIHVNGAQVYIAQNETNTVQPLTQTGSILVYLNGSTDYVDITGYSSSDSGSQQVNSGSGTTFNATLITQGGGATGATGAPGDPGGATGATGVTGATGLDGATGATGADSTVPGATGASGIDGATGATGPDGATGASGIDGATGASGIDGATGATGPDGATGASGIDGATGSTGPDGATGATGATGLGFGPISAGANPVSTALTTGSHTFDDGIFFDQADPAPWTAGQYVYMADQTPGSSLVYYGTLQFVNQGGFGIGFYLDYITSVSGTPVSGTSNTWLMSAAPTPQGATGATGATGLDGATGASGIDGATGASGIDGATGASGIDGATGATGPDGATGASGIDGATGATGPDGATGATGLDGATGASGIDGATGASGIDGATGSTGPDGATGASGIDGATGATGIDGATGATGPDGATGASGIDGATGATGETGATGPIYYGIAPSDYVSQAQLGTNQTITAGSDTVIQYGSTNDPQSWWNNGSNRFQPTQPGYYNIEYSVLWSTGTGTGQVNTQIHLNGSQIYIAQNQTNTAQPLTQNGAVVVYINGSTDYVDITGYTSSDSGSQQVNAGGGTRFNATLITQGGGATGATGDPGGATGATGATGLDGATGASGIDGATGASGIDGATGASGIDGATGASGIDGATGASGIDGATGATGATGVFSGQLTQNLDGEGYSIGNVASVGTGAGSNNVVIQPDAGTVGYTLTLPVDTGSSNQVLTTDGTGILSWTSGGFGATGATGATGQGFNFLGAWNDSSTYVPYDVVEYNGNTYVCINANGPNQSPDYTYYWTLIASAGATGASGIDGATGASGIDGATGASGIDGATGSTGPDGATGSTGPDGATGATGIDGATGASGIDGATGATGVDGATGASGVNGDKYSTTSSSLLTLSDYAVGSTITLTVEAGLAYTPAQSIVIAYLYDYTDHTVGTISSYDSGTGLLSAVITNADSATATPSSTWTVNLDGAVGAVGATGASGIDGATGASGIDGATGATGVDGATGASGIDGATGASGVDGATGASGLDGATGASGIDGATGATGLDGATGATGTFNGVLTQDIDGNGYSITNVNGVSANYLSGDGANITNIQYTNINGTPAAPTLDSVTSQGSSTTNGITVGSVGAGTGTFDTIVNNNLGSSQIVYGNPSGGGQQFNSPYVTTDGSTVTATQFTTGYSTIYTGVSTSGGVQAGQDINSSGGSLSVVGQVTGGGVNINNRTISGLYGGNIDIDPIGGATLRTVNGIEVWQNSYANIPVFQISQSSLVTTLLPNTSTNVSGFEIIGNPTATAVAPQTAGVMEHITGVPNTPSRIYNDGVGAYAAMVNRRYNGTSGSPTGVLAGQIMGRLGATPMLNDLTFPALSTTRIDFITTEIQTSTNQGSQIEFYATPLGSNTPTLTMQVDADNGILMTGNINPTDTYSLGNTASRWDSVWIGNSVNILDSTTLDNIAITVNNGALSANGISSLQVGNMALTSTGISLVTANSSSNIQIGSSGDTGYVQINMPGIKFNDNTIQTTAGIANTLLGQANGVATLNGAGQVPLSQLPITGGTIYQGTWDAANNTPTLADGSGTAGYEYAVTVSGTQNLGSGNISFNAGDFVIYNGSVWQDVPTGGLGVNSFNTRTGAVTLQQSDVLTALGNGGLTNQYLATPNITINSGSGFSVTGGPVVNLGNTITVTNTGILNIIPSTGVTATTVAGNTTISIGQPVGTANSVQFAGIFSTTTIQATSNITGGNLITAGIVSAYGDIYTGSSILTPNATIDSSGSITTGAGISAGGGGSFGGTVSAPYFSGDGQSLTNITGGQVNGYVGYSNYATVAGTVNQGSQTAITQVGTLNSLAVASTASVGNLTTGGNISAAGNITGGNLFVNAIESVAGNIRGGNLLTNGQVTATGNITGGNILTAGLVSVAGAITGNSTILATGNIRGGNLTSNGLITATGNITGGNITTVGSVSATGNITGAYIYGNGSTLTGITATAGATGATGASGATGPAGSPGGATGATGTPGTNGATGATGANGTNGATGATGTNGADGATGPTGATGSTGPNGATGSTGLTGATGATGTPGTNGATGATGVTGGQGATGSTGVTGDTGATGATGTFDGILTANIDGQGYSISNVDSVTANSITFADATTQYTAATTQSQGSWTPTLQFATTQGSQTYTTQIGNYIKTGNLVVLNFDIITSTNTGVGNVTITGLPFTSANQTGYQGSLQSTDYAGAGEQEVYTGTIAGNSSTIALYAYYVQGGKLQLKRATAADLGANLSLGGTITYISNS
jgi:collagen type VII alpha